MDTSWLPLVNAGGIVAVLAILWWRTGAAEKAVVSTDKAIAKASADTELSIQRSEARVTSAIEHLRADVQADIADLKTEQVRTRDRLHNVEGQVSTFKWIGELFAEWLKEKKP